MTEVLLHLPRLLLKSLIDSQSERKDRINVSLNG